MPRAKTAAPIPRAAGKPASHDGEKVNGEEHAHHGCRVRAKTAK